MFLFFVGHRPSSRGGACRPYFIAFAVDVLPFSRTLPFGGTNHGNMINSPSCISTKQPIYVCFIWIFVLLYDLYNIYVALNMTRTKVDKLTQSLYEWPVEMSCFRFPSKSFHRLFQITVSYVPQFFYLLQIEWSILDPMTGPGRSTDWISMMGIWINISTPFGLNIWIIWNPRRRWGAWG